MKRVVLSLMSSLKKLSKMMAFLFLFWYVFAVFGVHFLAGLLHSRCFKSQINSQPLTPQTGLPTFFLFVFFVCLFVCVIFWFAHTKQTPCVNLFVFRREITLHFFIFFIFFFL